MSKKSPAEAAAPELLATLLLVRRQVLEALHRTGGREEDCALLREIDPVLSKVGVTDVERFNGITIFRRHSVAAAQEMFDALDDLMPALHWLGVIGHVVDRADAALANARGESETEKAA